ncbi:MAG: hypothetical protein MI749_15035 [Desulfovibrionales bacterium]|nr:hypothetical protein [Desulfovibrionales bacterium]
MVFVDSGFLTTHISCLEKRYELSYYRDGACIEYFLDSRQDHEPVSQNLILSWDSWHRGIYVSKFYPELYRRAASKYLSAACFYLMVHHAVHLFHLRDECQVWLETDAHVFKDFYAKLREFEFKISRDRVGDRVCLAGVFHELSIPSRGIHPVVNILDRPWS